MKENKKKKNKRKRLKITLLIIEMVFTILALVVGGLGAYYTTASDARKIEIRNNLVKTLSGWSWVRNILLSSEQEDYDKNVKDSDFDESKIVVNENVKKLTGYTIIVVNINNDSGEVRLISVYRDTMLKIRTKDGDSVYSKANEAFFRGGAEGAITMLNTNLDLDIQDYVTVNFSGLTEIIDALGGIDVTITEDERFYINGYLVETRKVTGMDAPDVNESGTVHLSGLQATAYCRIRYTSYFDEEGNEYKDDLGRTARQRAVLSKLVDKAKAAGSDKIIKIAKRILNSNTKDKTFVKTSMDFDEIMDLIPLMIDFTLTDTVGFPYTLAMPTIDGKSFIVAEGLSYNVSKLHEFMYGEPGYKVSPSVRKINDYLIDYTGVDEVKLPEDREKETTTEEYTRRYR